MSGLFKHDADERHNVQIREGLGQTLVVAHEAPEASGPGEEPLNGLITNDKFCLRRTGQLHLSWPRSRGRLRRAVVPQLPDEVTHQGGQHARAAATRLARSAHQHADAHGPAALGPGLPAPSAVDDDRTGADRGAGVSNPAGGPPCG